MVVVLIGVIFTLQGMLANASFLNLSFIKLVAATHWRDVCRCFVVAPIFLVLAGISVINLLWEFALARYVWTQHLFILIQILHAVPTFLLVVQTVVQGEFIYLMTCSVSSFFSF